MAKCSCGEIHEEEDKVLGDLGISETIVVSTTVHPIRAWELPRVYILKHGLRGSEVEALADKFGWKQIK